MPARDLMVQRQQVLADFGEHVLRSDNVEQISSEACRLVGEALGTGRARILEVQQEEKQFLVRAGVDRGPCPSG